LLPVSTATTLIAWKADMEKRCKRKRRKLRHTAKQYNAVYAEKTAQLRLIEASIELVGWQIEAGKSVCENASIKRIHRLAEIGYAVVEQPSAEQQWRSLECGQMNGGQASGGQVSGGC